jgi:dienelactone hydrolase
MSVRVLSLVIVLFLAIPALADDKPDTKHGDEMIEKYLVSLTKEVSGRFLDGAKTRDEWEKKLPTLRQEYLDMLGLWPLPEKTPLHATVTGTLEHEGVVIEKLHYQSRPGLYVTGNLFRPKKSDGKLPAIFYVCGHAGRGRDGNKTAYQDHGLWFAKNGYVCLVVDTLQLGEIPGIHHGTYREGRWWWQALGYTPAGVECWNGIRGIDYLVSRPDVDAERIGVTGISGGGASTVWIAAADERVKVAVPVSGMSDLESYVTNKVINGHCDCMFLVNTYGWEWTTIAALIAPRPLLFANSDHDNLFPMDGNRRIIERLRKVYKMYDKPDLVDEYVSEGEHAYRPDLRVAIFKFINKHLKNDKSEVKDVDFKLLAGKELRVFAEDKDLPKDAINGKIDETFVKRADVKLPEEGKFAEWKMGMMKELRGKSFRGWPDNIPKARRTGGDSADFPPYDGYSYLQTEPALDKIRLFLEHAEFKDEPFRTFVVSQSPGLSKPTALDDFLGKDRHYRLYARGVDLDSKWNRTSPPNYVERSHALLGRTVDDGRVLDTLSALRFLDKGKDKKSWRIVGSGQAGIIAAYSALFDPSIKEVVITDPPSSHKDGPIFLNVLRVLDIPEALGLLAPDVKLTIVGGNDKAWERTAQLYKLAGVPEKLDWKRLPEKKPK